MTMFEELFALATSATLTMVLSADEKTGRMTINVIPEREEHEDEVEQPGAGVDEMVALEGE